MELKLYLLSPYEEYSYKHMCRRHWNYQWRGRSSIHPIDNKIIRLRKESFGGLLQAMDGKIYVLDEEGYEFVEKYEGGSTIEEICEDFNMSVEEGKQFTKKLNHLGL